MQDPTPRTRHPLQSEEVGFDPLQCDIARHDGGKSLLGVFNKEKSSADCNPVSLSLNGSGTEYVQIGILKGL